jgi:hypothetical protein
LVFAVCTSAPATRSRSEAKDEEAEIIFAALRQRDPAAARRIDATWAEAYVARGTKLLADGKDAEAGAQFELALQRDPESRKRIDAARGKAAQVTREIEPKKSSILTFHCCLPDRLLRHLLQILELSIGPNGGKPWAKLGDQENVYQRCMFRRTVFRSRKFILDSSKSINNFYVIT